MLAQSMYTIKEAAARTGLSTTVIRAWERRYGVVRPARSRSGYRLFDDAAIGRLRAMRRLVEAGWLPSEAARAVAAGEVEVVGEPSGNDDRTGEPPSPPTPEAERRRIIEEFVRAAAGHDADRVEAILDEIGARGRFEAVVDTLLLPAAAALGDAWASGRLDAGAEHAASTAILRRLAAAFQAAGNERPSGPPLLAGLPPGSRHELGVLAFAVAARRLGLAVRYLGADVPVASWVEAVRRTGAWLVVLGVVTPSDREPAIETAESIRRSRPDVLVALGGASAPPPPADAPASWIRLPDRVVDAAAFVDARRRERFEVGPRTTHDPLAGAPRRVRRGTPTAARSGERADHAPVDGDDDAG
jgi:DNA-binding transcriptional MerR regulator